MSKSKYAIECVLRALKNEFEITTGQENESIGMEIMRDRQARTIKITHAGYIFKILHRFGIESFVCTS